MLPQPADARRILWLVTLLALWGCVRPAAAPLPPPRNSAAPQSPPVTAIPWINELKREAQAAYDWHHRLMPRPLPCDPGYLAGGSGHIVQVADWAERAGLRRGDRIVSIGGAPTETSEERVRALAAVVLGGPLNYGVSRADRVVTVTLSCTSNWPVWSNTGSLLAAAASGNWDRCAELALEQVRLLRMPSSYFLRWRGRCLRAKSAVLGRPLDVNEARLVYEVHRLLLEEARYDPGGIGRIRGRLLEAAASLRSAGFGNMAADLEDQLRGAREVQAPAEPSPRPTGPGISRGTAFLVRPDGVLLTAFHLIEGAKRVTVSCPGQPPVLATVGEVARSVDLAVLTAPVSRLPYLSLAEARALRTGDYVFTIGFPATEILGREAKFTEGVVSSLSGPGGESTFIQISVPVQPGNSGGPLVDIQGRVVGVVTSSAAILPFLAVTGTLPQNVNWAVKSEYARPLFDHPPAIITKGRSEAINRTMQATCMVEAYGEASR